MTTLFDPAKLGAISIANRVVMAPLTRCRAPDLRVPNDIMVEYYRQRANAGLIFTEATCIDPLAVGYPDTPGLWNDAQVAGWRKVTDAVHQAGGKMVAQLWHVGRVSDPEYLGGKTPVSASAVPLSGMVNLLRPKRPFVTPEALSVAAIRTIINAYGQATQNAKRAGFDGVEIHAANGYLPDQFLSSNVNLRKDEYGGSIENRARFLLQAIDCAIAAWSADRVGVHLSPQGDAHEIIYEDGKGLFTHLAEAFEARSLAFVFVREAISAEGMIGGAPSKTPLLSTIRQHYRGFVIANDGYDQKRAEALLAQKGADAVAFGRDYIANPKLVQCFTQQSPLNKMNPETLYGPSVDDKNIGYTDYVNV